MLIHVRYRIDGCEARCWKVPPGMTPGALYSVPVSDRELLWAALYDEDRCLVRVLEAPAADRACAAARDYAEHGIMDEAWTHAFTPGCGQ